MRMKKVPIAKDEKGRTISVRIPEDPNKILVVNSLSRDPMAHRIALGQVFSVEEEED